MRYGVKTKMDSAAAIEKAIAYFGEEGLGLEVVEKSDCCAKFEGGGGFVNVFLDNKEGKTEVTLETREWDYHVKKFMQEIG
ncbi:MAG: hypothetical protein JXB35_10730 [Anaerolineae bacterium]|nr:hypothetical protein [Anaerolineae bacterium]